MSKVTLSAANSGDIKTISDLAYTIWNQHYPAIIGQEQVNYMLELMYSASGLSEQMEQKGHCFFLIHDHEQTVGFISVNQERENNWFLNKFYIDQTRAGKGVGTMAFEELKKSVKPAKITLTVNRQNYKSVNFYFKLGFKIEKTADFDIGHGYVMNDFVMVWEQPG